MNNNLPQKSNSNQIKPNINNASSILGARNSALTSMYYNARITRKNPTAIVFLIDQSGSMEQTFYQGRTKAEAVSDIVNSFFSELIDRCIRENEVRDYFDIMVIGYGKEKEDGTMVSYCWEGNLVNREWVKISELKDNVLKIDTITTVKKMPFGDVPSTESKKVWITPYADSLTPMKEALERCKYHLESWVVENESSFPPMVFNITDGYPTDIDDISEIIDISYEIKSLFTKDGNVLLFNCLLKENDENFEIIPFPTSNENLIDNEYYLALYEASSELPKAMTEEARKILRNDEFKYINPRGVLINADANYIVQILNIGSNFTLNNAE